MLLSSHYSFYYLSTSFFLLVFGFLLEYYKIKPTEDPNSSPLAKLAPSQEAAQISAETQKQEEKRKSKDNKKNNEKIITSSD
jgi:hypothetical protein